MTPDWLLESEAALRRRLARRERIARNFQLAILALGIALAAIHFLATGTTQ
jgi:hypothetical protein